MTMCFVLLFSNDTRSTVMAEGELLPYTSPNTNIYNRDYSALVATSTGYLRLFPEYDSNSNRTKSIIVENYDDNFNLISRNKIASELEIYGGFYSGSDAYYICYGQNNKEQVNSKEVIRVVKYSKEWKRLGACSIPADTRAEPYFVSVRYPFDDFGLSMLEVNGKLYVATTRQGYVDSSVGQGHTGLYMLQIDINTMTGGVVEQDLWHSFSQHLAAKDKDNIFLLEESEGSRSTIISKFSESDTERKMINVLQYGGERTSAWAIPTYASADDIVVTGENVLAVGKSIDQSRYSDESYNKSYNIYLSVTPLSDFSADSTRLKWMTNDNAEDSYVEIKLSKINDNRVLLMWQRYGEFSSVDGTDSLSDKKLHYVFLDGSGNKISNEFVVNATISDCDPILKNGKLSFYTSSDVAVNFYSIDTSTGEFSKKCYDISSDDGDNYDSDVPKKKGEWKKIDGYWYYYDGNGVKAVNEWIDGYWLGDDGALKYNYKGSWKNNSKGWWFEDTSGWYPKNQWQKINGKWYYFCADGYMDYSEYRDGCWLNADGSWNESYSGGHWSQDSKGWWYEDNGWYPVNQYLWIDGTKYWFGSDGYWK